LNRRLLRAAVALAAAASLALGMSVAPVRGAERVARLGLDLPLSGIDGASSIPARNAVQLAIDAANRRGFPGGVRVALEDLDDAVGGKHDPAQGAQNVRSFVADPDVFAIVGPMNSNVAKAEIPIVDAAGLAEISFAATAVELTRGPQATRGAFFRVCASDDRQGVAAARFARRLGARRAFVIDDNESYGKGLADVFARAFPAAGGAIVGHEHLVPFTLDFQPLLTKIRADGPDAIFFGGIVSTGGAILRKQMGDVGLAKVPYFGGDGLASPEYVPLAGAAADGTYFTLIAPDVFRLPEARGFLAAYRARFRSDPGNYSAGAFAAASVALDALRRGLGAHPGRLPGRGEVLRGVAATAALVTPIGPVTFDGRGDLRRPVVSLYRVEHGRTEFVEEAGVRP